MSEKEVTEENLCQFPILFSEQVLQEVDLKVLQLLCRPIDLTDDENLEVADKL